MDSSEGLKCSLEFYDSSVPKYDNIWRNLVPRFVYEQVNRTRSRGYKTFFMLISTEHKISTANKAKILTNEVVNWFKDCFTYTPNPNRNRTETVKATELYRFVFGRPFTYELNPWTKSKKMTV